METISTNGSSDLHHSLTPAYKASSIQHLASSSEEIGGRLGRSSFGFDQKYAAVLQVGGWYGEASRFHVSSSKPSSLSTEAFILQYKGCLEDALNQKYAQMLMMAEKATCSHVQSPWPSKLQAGRWKQNYFILVYLNRSLGVGSTIYVSPVMLIVQLLIRGHNNHC